MSRYTYVRGTAWLIIVPALIALALFGGCQAAHAAAPVSQCEEDQACWDCATMGNRICGPTGSGEGCVYDDVTDEWVYSTGELCRGIGAEPLYTFDFAIYADQSGE